MNTFNTHTFNAHIQSGETYACSSIWWDDGAVPSCSFSRNL